jgi:hypothetical protein
MEIATLVFHLEMAVAFTRRCFNAMMEVATKKSVSLEVDPKLPCAPRVAGTTPGSTIVSALHVGAKRCSGGRHSVTDRQTGRRSGPVRQK